VEAPKPPPPAPPVVASPAPPPPRPTVITQPDWIRRPNADDLAQYYPDRAQRLGVAGSAELACTVTQQGTLTECSVANEEPSDQGFGTAALKMTRLFKMRPQTRDGQPVGGAKINIPIRFQLPKE
jgi:protein TonB